LDVFLGTVNKILNKYIVDIKELRQGEHIFNFDVDDSFFAEFKESEISRAKVVVDLNLQKHSNMLELYFNIEGVVEVVCDRCLDRFFIPISYNGDVFIKILDSISDEEKDDDVWYISSNESELDLAHYIYESICLSLPIQRFHGILGTLEEDCDKEMMKRLNELSVKDSDSEVIELDPRWEKLKDLLQN
jgi:uncharacterized metal-binding protein YceD (DUF177 family)